MPRSDASSDEFKLRNTFYDKGKCIKITALDHPAPIPTVFSHAGHKKQTAQPLSRQCSVMLDIKSKPLRDRSGNNQDRDMHETRLLKSFDAAQRRIQR